MVQQQENVDQNNFDKSYVLCSYMFRFSIGFSFKCKVTLFFRLYFSLSLISPIRFVYRFSLYFNSKSEIQLKNNLQEWIFRRYIDG